MKSVKAELFADHCAKNIWCHYQRVWWRTQRAKVDFTGILAAIEKELDLIIAPSFERSIHCSDDNWCAFDFVLVMRSLSQTQIRRINDNNKNISNSIRKNRRFSTKKTTILSTNELIVHVFGHSSFLSLPSCFANEIWIIRIYCDTFCHFKVVTYFFVEEH